MTGDHRDHYRSALLLHIAGAEAGAASSRMCDFVTRGVRGCVHVQPPRGCDRLVYSGAAWRDSAWHEESCSPSVSPPSCRGPDSRRRYQFSNVPNGLVVLEAGAPHAYQRCAAIATVSGANPVIAATTITDAQGRYSLCHLPAGRGGLEVWLNGVASGYVVNISGDQVLDFDLTQ